MKVGDLVTYSYTGELMVVLEIKQHPNQWSQVTAVSTDCSVVRSNGLNFKILKPRKTNGYR